MIQQFTYTASPWGKSGTGWMVFQQSGGVSADVPQKLYELYRYEESKSAAGKTRYPVQFVYLPMQTGGGAVLAQTTFTGMRWWGDPRPGDFYSHVLLLDNNALKESAREGFNPVRLYMSPAIQSSFPENLKEKALRIFRKEISWEQPPALEELQRLGDLPENPQLAFDVALDAIPERAITQLGALVRAIVMRTTGKLDDPIVFDSGNKYSPLVMSLALDLIPPTWRARTWFAVHFAENALQHLPLFSSLTFYGTDTSQASNPDSGIVSGVDFSQDPFRFCSRYDIRAFKEQLDLLGGDVSLELYKELLGFSKVSLGKTVETGSLRSAAAFARRFPGMMDRMEQGVANAFADYNYYKLPLEYRIASVVAWFELDLASFKENALRVCSACMQDFDLLHQAFQTLEGDAARISFLDAVSQEGEKSDATAFVNRIMETSLSFDGITRCLAEDSLLRLALEYRVIRDNLKNGRSDDSLRGTLATLEKLKAKAGPGVNGLPETKLFLDYRQAIARIHSVDEIEPVLRNYAKTGFPEGADVIDDVLARVSPTTVRDIVACGMALNALGFNGAEMICEKWNYERMAGRRKGNGIRMLEPPAATHKRHPGHFFYVIACVIAIALAFITGFFMGKMIGGRNRSVPFEPHRVEKSMEKNRPKIQETVSRPKKHEEDVSQ